MELEYEDFFYFFTYGDTIPDWIRKLVENTKQIRQKTKTVYYTLLGDGTRIDLICKPYLCGSMTAFAVDPESIEEHAEEIPDLSSFVRNLELQVNRGIGPVYSEQIVADDVFNPKVDLIDMYRGSWVSLLIRRYGDGRNEIIGAYRGIAGRDEQNRPYNTMSIVTIAQGYRGKGFCVPLASFTYRSLRERLGVDYICLSIQAENRFAACKCYVRAAIDAEFVPFIDKGRIFNKEGCAAYSEYPIRDMVLIHSDVIDDDDIVAQAFQSCFGDQ
jgi:hypothetical protein